MLWIVLPTHNEAAIIEGCLEQLLTFLRTNIHEPWRVIVADNASRDRTREIVRDGAARAPELELLELDTPGKGRAVLTAWHNAERASSTDKDVYAFMDADLATDIIHLPEIIAAVRSGADIAAASRYLPGARAQRSVLDHLVSRANRTLLRACFGLAMSDPPCGMKAISARVVRDIVPHVRDTAWFFDTELCIRAQDAGMRIVEIPVAWCEPRAHRSLIKLLRITRANLRAMRTLARTRARLRV